MSEFRTPVGIQPHDSKLDYHSPALFMGSCFTENIGYHLQNLKFPVVVNPFGVVYNPLSVAQSLRFLLRGKPFSNADLEYHNGLWFSFYHHSRFSHPDAGQALAAMNHGLAQGAAQLRKVHFLFITLGTAWVYRHKKHGMVVSNNHKLPANQFTRQRLGVAEIVQGLQPVLEDINELNPTAEVFFTLSPVRHWKDGAEENFLSKSTLRLAIDELTRLIPQSGYFPAYEIMMDDLRDYRFYADDMLHPSAMAESYIREKFAAAFFSKEAVRIARKVSKITAAAAHRPFHPGAAPHQQFLQETLARAEKLEQQHPFLSFANEKAQLRQGVIKK